MSQVADDLDDIRALNNQRGPRCKAGAILSSLPEGVTETLEAALDDDTIEKRAVVKWLKERHGIDIAYDSFRRHISGVCRCE